MTGRLQRSEARNQRSWDPAVAERVDLRSIDDELFAWAVTGNRWLLTENVRDYHPILLRAMQAGGAITGLRFTSSRTFPRSRQNPGPLIEALHRWLSTGPAWARRAVSAAIAAVMRSVRGCSGARELAMSVLGCCVRQQV